MASKTTCGGGVACVPPPQPASSAKEPITVPSKAVRIERSVAKILILVLVLATE
jgi:hypothetical protein